MPRWIVTLQFTGTADDGQHWTTEATSAQIAMRNVLRMVPLGGMKPSLRSVIVSPIPKNFANDKGVMLEIEGNEGYYQGDLPMVV